MWKLDPPILISSEVARDCAKGAHDSKLRRQVSECSSEFDANAAEYITLAKAGLLHTANDATFGLSGLTSDELISLYERGMVVRKSGRRHYNKIVLAAKHKRCSYCQYVKATTLDHFVPKDKSSGFPALAIEPMNLVPVCKDCNHALSSDWGHSAASEFLHPYFIPDVGQWLGAVIRHTAPIEVVFFATPDSSLNKTLRDRICNQFDRLGLSDVYGSAVAKDIVAFAEYFPRLGDATEVSKHLAAEGERGLAGDPNDLRGVLFSALSRDDWYCEGGYAQV